MPEVNAIRRLRGDEGISLVETAISCSVFFAVPFGICQTSHEMYVYQFTSDAAREATRYAIVRGSTSCTNTPSLSNFSATTDSIESFVQSLSFPGITTSKIDVSTSWYSASGTMPCTWPAGAAGICNAPGNPVNVAVSYPQTFQVPFSTSASLALSGTSQMVISQ